MNGGNSYRVKLREREARKGGREEEKGEEKRKKGDEKCW